MGIRKFSYLLPEEIQQLTKEEKIELARDTDSIEEMETLFRDKDREVRQELVLNANIPEYMLKDFTKDEDAVVRELAIQHLKERGVITEDEEEDLKVESEIVGDIIDTIKNAGRNLFMINLVYIDRFGNVTTRRVEPYEIRGNYFWGYNLDPESSISGTRGIRMFRLDRILDARRVRNPYGRGYSKFIPRWPIKLGMKSFASILDFPRESLDPDIWDIDDKSAVPVLKEKVSKQILKIVDKLFKKIELDDYKKWIKHIYLSGSEASLQYNPASDVDIHLYMDFEEFRKCHPVDLTDEQVRDILNKYIREFTKEEYVKGTQHPLEFTLQKPGKLVEVSDAYYDVLNDTWIVEPLKIEKFYNPLLSYRDVIEEAEVLQEELDLALGKLRRSLVDYFQCIVFLDYLKKKDFVEKEKIIEIENFLKERDFEIERCIGALIDSKQMLWELRNLAYQEIKDEKNKKMYQEDKRNIFYKIVERNNYLKLIKKIQKVWEDEDISKNDKYSQIYDLVSYKIENKTKIAVKSKVVAVDFDGTVVLPLEHTETYSPFYLLPGVREYLTKLKKDGWVIVIYTARPKADVLRIRDFLLQQSIPFDYINYNPYQSEQFNGAKIDADVYIDDKAIRFINWPDAYSKIKDLEKKDDGKIAARVTV